MCNLAAENLVKSAVNLSKCMVVTKVCIAHLLYKLAENLVKFDSFYQAKCRMVCMCIAKGNHSDEVVQVRAISKSLFI